MVPKMIFGLGTGRCGTWTLSRIFAMQPDVASKHEGVPLPWEVNNDIFYNRMLRLWVNVDSPIIASVSYVWINYIGIIMGNLKDPKCVCLKRSKSEVVKSFLRHSPFNNHWTDPESLHWDPNRDVNTNLSYQWPKYDLPKKEAIEMYWNRYYAHADYLQSQYPDNFAIFNLNEALNSGFGQRRMLSFAGIKVEDQVIMLNQKLNALHRPKGEIQEAIDVHPRQNVSQ